MVMYPNTLFASLTKKLMVRQAYLISKKIPTEGLKIGPFINSDREFCKRFDLDLEKFQKFASDWIDTKGKVIEASFRKIKD